MKKFFLLLSSLFGMNGHKNYGSNDVIQAVDLGLSVKWASCNVGASAPEKTGGYYAWGETEEKSKYDWNTYIHCDGTISTCHNIGSNICGTQYDVAHVKWGGQWRMPTHAEVKEFVKRCTWAWTTQNGVKGMKVTGPNGNNIFLPAAGTRNGNAVIYAGNLGYYWSGSLNESNESNAWDLYFSYGGNDYWDYYRRYYGFQVRPVEDNKEYNDSTKPVALTGDADAVTSHSAEITCSFKNIPANAQYGIIVTSSNGTSSFPPTINNDDSCIFYLENLQPQITYTYQAYILYHGTSYYGDKKNFTTPKKNDDVVTPDTVPGGAIDLGLSVKWASCNVGASSPEDYGGYYAWGETEEMSNYTWETYKYYADGEYTNIGSNICGTQYDVAHVKLGGQWRMPTLAEQQELVNKCTWTWTTRNGVKGMKVTGPNGNSIFFPAAGYRYGGGVNDSGYYGYYWSGSLSGGSGAWGVNFNDTGDDDWRVGSRDVGFQVRPVEDNKEYNDSTKPVALTGDADAVTSHSAEITCSFKNIPANAQYGIIVTSSNGTSSFPPTINNDDSCIFYLENLQPQITYTYQAYILYHGTSYYGDKKSFTTLKKNDDVVTSDTAIDLGLSVKWASFNVGASKPEEFGGYYAWGETEEKNDYSLETYKYYANGKYTSIGTSICGTQYDVAHVKWGGKWRMPTIAELKELVNECTWTWTTLNGVKGMKVTGPNGNSIFLPAAGNRNVFDVDNAGFYGYYWSGSRHESSERDAWGLDFNGNGSDYWDFSRRDFGFSVRPVSEF